MSLITLTSASGSPGVTTTALGLALTWPRLVLLVEADPTGGSSIFAGYLRGQVEHTGGLIDLAMAHRHGTLVDALPRSVMPLPDSPVQLLPGTRAHGQATSLENVWAPLAGTLRGLEATGQDVIVDAGRLGLAGSPEPLIYAADLALLVTRTSLPALSGARSWSTTLREEFEKAGAAASLGVLLVGQGHPYGPTEVSNVLHVPVTASVAWDEPAAAVFSTGEQPPRRFESSPLLRSLRATVASIGSTLAAQRADLAAAGGQA
jgi:hypothetical protein